MAEAGGAFEYITGLREYDRSIPEEEDFSLHTEVGFYVSCPQVTPRPHSVFLVVMSLRGCLGQGIREVLQGGRHGVETLRQSPGSTSQY